MPEIQRALKLSQSATDATEPNALYDKALTTMQGLNMTQGQMRTIVEHALTPESRLSQRAVKKFEQTADDESKAKLLLLMSR